MIKTDDRSTWARVRRAGASAALAAALALGAALPAVTAFPAVAWADEAADGVTFSADEPPALASAAALLVDTDTGTVLYEQDADAQRYPASTTKIMTALVVLEHANLDDVVTVEESDFDEVTADSSVAGLKPGDTLTVRDLLACLLVPSGNDASYVLARYVGGGDWHAFVDMMNERAAELGCTNTHFVNPCGLHDDDHYTSARDLARIFEAALTHPEFVEAASSATWDLPATPVNPARTLKSTDMLIKPESPVYMDGLVTAAKTGSTPEAGRCLVASAEKDGMHLVGVTLGAGYWTANAQGVTGNFTDMRSLFEWGFGAWVTGPVVSAGDVLASADVTLSSDGKEVDATATDEVVATVPRGTELSDLTVEPSWPDSFQAPVEQGQELGRARVSLDGRVLGQVGLAAASAMELSIPAFVLWWLSDPVHAVIVVAVVVALLVVVGVAGSRRSRRKRERLRLEAMGNRVMATPYRPERLQVAEKPGVGKAGKGGKHAAPKHGAR